MDRKLQSNLANYILGNTQSLQIVGNPILLATLHEVTQASRELLECLRSESTEGEILESIEKKKAAAERWKRITGERWPL